MVTSAPLEDTPLPAVNEKSPPLPEPVDAPVVIEKRPEFPLEALPVESWMKPLTPLVPESGVASSILPLEVADPSPDVRVIAPPELLSPRPAFHVM